MLGEPLLDDGFTAYACDAGIDTPIENGENKANSHLNFYDCLLDLRPLYNAIVDSLNLSTQNSKGPKGN